MKTINAKRPVRINAAVQLVTIMTSGQAETWVADKLREGYTHVQAVPVDYIRYKLTAVKR